MNKELTIQAFLDYLRQEQRAQPQTVETYECRLKGFEQWMNGHAEALTWQDVDRDVIRDWMSSEMDHGIKPSTIKTRLSALRSFYRFALRNGIVSKDPTHLVDPPKAPHPLPMFVREKEMDSLLDDERWDDRLKSLRQRAIVTLFYETGIRCGELHALNNNDVDMKRMQLRVNKGKGNKTRIVPFGEEVARAIENYRRERDKHEITDTEALFIGQKGRRLSTDTIYQDTHNALTTVTSLKKRSPHVLRHSYATALLNHGANLEGVRQLLGHANLDATQIYTHATFEQLRQSYKKAHPRNS